MGFEFQCSHIHKFVVSGGRRYLLDGGARKFTFTYTLHVLVMPGVSRQHAQIIRIIHTTLPMAVSHVYVWGEVAPKVDGKKEN